MSGILEILLSNALLAGALALGASFARRVGRNAPLTHALWVLVLVKLVTPPLVSLPLPDVSWLRPREPVAPVATKPASPPTRAQAEPRLSERDATPSLEAALAAERTARRLRAVLEQARERKARLAGLDPAAQVPGPPVDHSQEAAPAALSAPPPSPDANRLRQAVAAVPIASPMARLPAGATLLEVAWLGGALFWWGVATARALRFARGVRRSRPAPATWIAEVGAVAERLALSCPPRVVVVNARVPPLVWHLTRSPVLVLPFALISRLSPEERRTVIVHELAHLRRRDHWLRWLELLVGGLYWWCPVAWWARRGLHDAEEECCDAWVRWNDPASSNDYARTLLRTFDFLSPDPDPLPAGASGMGQGARMERRFRMILGSETPHVLTRRGRAAVAALALLGLPLAGRPTVGDDSASPAPAKLQAGAGTSAAIGAPGGGAGAVTTQAAPARGASAGATGAAPVALPVQEGRPGTAAGGGGAVLLTPGAGAAIGSGGSDGVLLEAGSRPAAAAGGGANVLAPRAVQRGPVALPPGGSRLAGPGGPGRAPVVILGGAGPGGAAEAGALTGPGGISAGGGAPGATGGGGEDGEARALQSEIDRLRQQLDQVTHELNRLQGGGAGGLDGGLDGGADGLVPLQGDAFFSGDPVAPAKAGAGGSSDIDLTLEGKSYRLDASGRTIRLREGETGQQVWSLGLESPAQESTVTGDGRQLILKSESGALHVIEIRTGKVLSEIRAADELAAPSVELSTTRGAGFSGTVVATTPERLSTPGGGALEAHPPVIVAGIAAEGFPAQASARTANPAGFDVVQLATAMLDARAGSDLARSRLGQAAASGEGVVARQELQELKLQLEASTRKVKLFERFATTARESARRDVERLKELERLTRGQFEAGKGTSDSVLAISSQCAQAETLANMLDALLEAVRE